MKTLIPILFASLFLLSACGGDNRVPPKPQPVDPDDFCPDAALILDGAAYYEDYANCVADAYPGKTALADALNRYLNDAGSMALFTQAVCATIPAEVRPQCYSGPFSLPSEILGFRNILQSTSQRSQVCLMAEETGAQVHMYMNLYTEAECGQG